MMCGRFEMVACPMCNKFVKLASDKEVERFLKGIMMHFLDANGTVLDPAGDKYRYSDALRTGDYTKWLEYFLGGFSHQMVTLRLGPERQPRD